MAQSKSFNEVFDVGVIRMTRIFELLVEFWIIEVHVGDTWSVLDFLRCITAKLEFSRGELLEFHNVLGQRTRLVTKNVIDHSKLFVKS